MKVTVIKQKESVEEPVIKYINIFHCSNDRNTINTSNLCDSLDVCLMVSDEPNYICTLKIED